MEVSAVQVSEPAADTREEPFRVSPSQAEAVLLSALSAVRVESASRRRSHRQVAPMSAVTE